MINCFAKTKQRILTSTLLLLVFSMAFAQKPKLKAREVIDNYLEAIGGAERWKELHSRVATMTIGQYDQSSDLQKLEGLKNQTKFFLEPDYYLELTIENLKQAILCEVPECIWYYSERSLLLVFLDPAPVKFDDTYPRVNALEALDLKVVGDVQIEEEMYRIDFRDGRRKDKIQSLYFDPNTFLVKKQSSLSNTDVRWTFVYEDYREKDGFLEPYSIKLMSNNDLFMMMSVKEISYNGEVNTSLFNPPKPCDSKERYLKLDEPYFLKMN